ncbi:MAG TPA: TPM domain-containing protein [Thermoanaerobaculia bacterium]|jgi:uncharacterized membrane protein|nr:TPM domain-containing protein [Thermoanaerobaculia bacterium]
MSIWRRPLLSPAEIARVEAKIASAERLTSAEIVVVLTRSTWMGIKRRARRIFRQRGLDTTAERNAVLLLVDTRNREVLVYGDAGIDSRVGQQFWDEVRDAMIEELREGRLAAGLSTGVRLVAEKLAAVFPTRSSDVNELPNGIIFD